MTKATAMGVEFACSMPRRLKGLYGRNGFDAVLLLAPCNDIHTFGMHHRLDIAFVAPTGMVLEAHRDVGPNRRLRNRRAAAVLERIAANQPWYEPGSRIALAHPGSNDEDETEVRS